MARPSPGETDAVRCGSQVYSSHKLALLKQMAGIAVRRPDDWRPLRVRHEFLEKRTEYRRPTECFACRNRDRVRNWHHVIQIQNGGSNATPNLVSLCEVCHARIHPWLPVDLAHASGWSSAGEIVSRHADAVMERLEHPITGEIA